MDLNSRLRQTRTLIDHFDGQRSLLARQLADAEARQHEAQHRAEVLQASLDVLRGLEGEVRQKVEGGITGLISRGLTEVFGTPTEVVLEAGKYRDSTTLEVKIKQGGLTLPVDGAKGGSVAQVLGFLWQVYMVRSANLTPTLILDEPFAMVRAEYRPALGELLRELAKAGMQLIIVDDERGMMEYADTVYEVVKGGEAKLNLLQCRGESEVL